jgi:hypothetical protein
MLNQIVRNTRQQHKKYLARNSTLHAANDDPRVVKFLLDQVAQAQEVQFVASILNKQFYFDRSCHPNELYQDVIAFTVQQAVEVLQVPVTDAYIVMERSFTKSELNASLRDYVASKIDIPTEQVTIAKKDSSEWGYGLQVADYVAWSLFQKYERANNEFATIIQQQIASEVNIGAKGRSIQPVDSFWK